MEKYFNISRIISKALEGIASEDELTVLSDWLEESERNKELWESFQEERNREEAFRLIESFNKEEAKKALHKKLGIHRSTKTIMFSWVARAAVVFFVVGISIWLFNQIQRSKHEVVHSIEFHIPAGKAQAILTLKNGEQLVIGESKDSALIQHESGKSIVQAGSQISYEQQDDSIAVKGVKADMVEEEYNTLEVPLKAEFGVTLSDGTKVYLNAGSRLRYPVHFRKDKRYVEVEGEAYFEVAHNPQWPFVVRDVHGNITEVKGTTFNVSSYADERLTVVTLVEGKVDFVSNTGNQRSLLPGKAAFYDVINDELSVKDVNVAEITAWQKGLVVFNNKRLEDIFSALSRWYGIEVVFENKEAKNLRFSVDIKRYDDLEKLLKLFELTKTVHFEYNNNKLSVK